MKKEKRYRQSFKLECIQVALQSNDSISQTAKNLNLKKQTLARWIRIYHSEGKIGLENKKPGAKVKPIDPKIKNIILQLWQERNRTAYSMRKSLTFRDINITEYSIRKVYKCNNLKTS